MSIILILVGLLVICFGLVVAFGAPYLPTLKKQTSAALDLLGLKKGQTLLDIGSGDGRVLKEALRRGHRAIGYELNPVLVLISKITTLKYRGRVQIIWGNYWRKDWPKADGIYAFLLPKYMDKLNKKLIQYPHKPVAVVSYAFRFSDEPPSNENEGVYLYKY